jgi:4-hydroxybenzoate polyprenyltransferase
MGVNRVLVYLLAALSVRPSLGPALGFGCLALLSYLIGLTYVAKQENLRELRGVWPLAFLAVPFAHLQALTTPTGMLLYGLLAAWVLFTLSLLSSRGRRDIPGAVGQFIAGICLLDGLLVAGQGQPVLAALCIVGFAVTRVFQRRIPGT